MKTRYEMYISQCHKVQQAKPQWRWGQVLYNVLHDADPKLADSIRATNLDPFYMRENDHRINRFLAYLELKMEEG